MNHEDKILLPVHEKWWSLKMDSSSRSCGKGGDMQFASSEYDLALQKWWNIESSGKYAHLSLKELQLFDLPYWSHQEMSALAARHVQCPGGWRKGSCAQRSWRQSSPCLGKHRRRPPAPRAAAAASEGCVSRPLREERINWSSCYREEIRTLAEVCMIELLQFLNW